MALYGEKITPPKRVTVPPVRKLNAHWPVKPERSPSTKLYGAKPK